MPVHEIRPPQFCLQRINSGFRIRIKICSNSKLYQFIQRGHYITFSLTITRYQVFYGMSTETENTWNSTTVPHHLAQLTVAGAHMVNRQWSPTCVWLTLDGFLQMFRDLQMPTAPRVMADIEWCVAYSHQQHHTLQCDLEYHSLPMPCAASFGLDCSTKHEHTAS